LSNSICKQYTGVTNSRFLKQLPILEVQTVAL